MGKIFNKGLSEDDQQEGLFERLKNIENAKKNQLNNNIETELSNVFNYLKSLGQEAKDLMDEIEDENDDIDDGKNLKLLRYFFVWTLKKTDAAAYDYVLKDVNSFIQKIESMSEKINLSLFEDFFESSSPADYAKTLINTKNPNENKEIVAEIKNKISDLKDRIKKNEWNRKKNKNADETLKIIEKILDYNKNAPKYFQLASKVGKKNQNQRLNKYCREDKIKK